MRASIRLAAAVLSVGLAAAACSDSPQEPAAAAPTATTAAPEPTEDDADSHDHGATDGAAEHDATPAIEGPVIANVLGSSTGSYAELPPGGSGLTVGGTVTMIKTESGTEITTEATGLTSGEEHAAHLHDGSCSEFGGHYMDDHSGPMAPPNEIWLSSSADPEGPLEPDMYGTAVGTGRAEWLARQQPLSMMIHDSEFPGLPIICADFAAYDAPARLVLEAVADDVATMEYSINGGDWLPYEGVVEIAEPGSHTVSFAGVDAAGERSEPQEIAFAVAGGTQ